MKLHDLIIDYQSKEAIDQIQTSNASVNQRNENGLTPLQLAVREGMLEVVLWLIGAGATTNVDFVAQTRGHTLISQVLTVCDEDVNYDMDQSVIEAILCWAVITPTEKVGAGLLQLLLPRLYSSESPMISGLIELSTKLNKSTLVELLLAHGKPRQSEEILTAAFWAALNNNEELFNKLCATNADYVLALLQLQKMNKPEFDHFYNAASEAVQNEFLTRDHTTVYIPEEKHTVAHQNAYRAASHSNATQLKIYCKKPEVFCAVLSRAHKNKNWVALDTLLDVAENDVLFLEFLLKTNQPELFSFWLMNANCDMYEFALSVHENKPILSAFLNASWSIQGVLHCIASRGVKRDALPAPKSIALFKNLDCTEDLVRLTLQLCLEDRHDALLIDTSPIRKRFGINQNGVERAQLLGLPDVLWTSIILPCLANADMNEFKGYSDLANEFVLRTRVGNRGVILSHQIKLLDNFAQQLRQEVKDISCCSWLSSGSKICSGLLPIPIVWITLASYFFIKKSHIRQNIFDAMNKAGCGNSKSDCISAVKRICFELCEQLGARGRGDSTGEFMSLVFAFLCMGLVLACVLVNISVDFRDKREKIGDLRLSRFSADIQQKTHELLAEFENEEAFALINLTSSFEEMIEAVNGVLSNKKIEYNNLPIKVVGEEKKEEGVSTLGMFGFRSNPDNQLIQPLLQHMESKMGSQFQ